mmetsp:Transcript_4017/g.12062  ORF Transcript_4017/g.12062 Transcript_4017/m.12062 type:complete len:144 (+) Transcript_4017:146-577(+)
MAAFVAGVGVGAGSRARAVSGRWRMCEEGDGPVAKPRIRKEIYDGFKKDKYEGFEEKGMGSKLHLDLRPNTMRKEDVCGDCKGEGTKLCGQCLGREYHDIDTGKAIICEGCGGKPVTCSTCVGTGKVPSLDGKWWDRLLTFWQ